MMQRKWARLASAVIVLSLLVAACGDGGSDGLAVGDDAPDFELPGSAGGTVSLADYADEPVLLYFHMAEG
jgi:hypothetical protein